MMRTVVVMVVAAAAAAAAAHKETKIDHSSELAFVLRVEWKEAERGGQTIFIALELAWLRRGDLHWPSACSK